VFDPRSPESRADGHMTDDDDEDERKIL